MNNNHRVKPVVFIIFCIYDTPGLVCSFLYFLLRVFYSLYIIYERVQITPDQSGSFFKGMIPIHQELWCARYETVIERSNYANN